MDSRFERKHSKHSRKIIALTLAAIMAAGSPLAVFAAEDEAAADDMIVEEEAGEPLQAPEITEDSEVNSEISQEEPLIEEASAESEGSEDIAMEDETEADLDAMSDADQTYSLNQSEVTLYYVSDELRKQITIPEGIKSAFQIQITPAYSGDISYHFWSTESDCYLVNSFVAEVSADGLVTAKEEGDETIRVDGDGFHKFLTVHVKDYDEEYADSVLDAYVDKYIRPLPTKKQQGEAIVKYVAENYNYDYKCSGRVGMVIYGGGDCWASTDMITYMCGKVGIPATDWIEDRENFSALRGGHMKAVMEIDGDYYTGEAGYNGEKPRHYKFEKLDGPFSIKKLTDTTCEITRYDGMDKDITIPDQIGGYTVTSIGRMCFYRAGTQITSATIPDTVTNIGDFAFAGTKLTTLTIPAAVTSIGKDICWNTTSFKEYKVAAGNRTYKSVDGAIFTADGSTLVVFPTAKTGSYVIPDGTKEIQGAAFASSNLTEITIPGSVTTLGNCAFQYASIKNVHLNEGLVTIGECAFASMRTRTITIPSTVKSIQAGALQNITGGILVRSMDAVIGEQAMPHGFVAAFEGSTTQKYAQDNNLKFLVLNQDNTVTLKKEWFSLSSTEYTYSGSENRPYVKASGGIVTSNSYYNPTEYTVTYENNIDAGTAQAIITGKGIFSGTITLPYVISPMTVSMDSIYAAADANTCFLSDYTGGCRPTIKVRYGSLYYGKQLVQGKDFSVTYSGNDDLGEASATLTMIGNYTSEETKTITFRVYEHLPKLGKIDDVTFNGRYQNPAVNLPGLVKDTDYYIGYSNHYHAGTATVTVIGTGNYKGEETATFQIRKMRLPAIKLSSNEKKQNYTGEEIKPSIWLYYDVPYGDGSQTYRESLSEGTDYVLTYSDNVDPGEATVTATAAEDSDFTGSSSDTYKIYGNLPEISLDQDTFTYDGSEKKPRVTAGRLKEGRDFFVSYEGDMTNIGTVNLTAKGSEYYRGEKTASYKIVQASLPLLAGDTGDRTYTGSAICPDFTIPGLKEGKDYDITWTDNLNAGTATATARGKGNYKGTSTLSFRIVPTELPDITADAEGKVYTGKEICPAVTVGNLKMGRDYSVIYSNNINAGTAVITVSGMGNYTGFRKAEFRIQKAALPELSADTRVQIWTGSEIHPEAYIDGLKKNTDYELSYINCVDTGTATIRAVGKGNYEGESVKTFRIAQEIGQDKIKVDIQPYVYDGTEKKPEVHIDGLTEGTDYTVTYEGGQKAGDAKVIITGQGDYAGVYETSYKITPAVLPRISNTLSDEAYTGRQHRPKIVIQGLSEGTDYVVSYVNNIGAGTAKAVATGIGNYTGTQEAVFRIIAPVYRSTPEAVRTIVPRQVNQVVVERITIKKKPASVKAKAKKRKVTVTWGKIRKNKKNRALLKQIRKIEIQYSKDRSFRTGVQTRRIGSRKTRVKLTMTSKGKWFVRVRYCDGQNGYSRWSKTRMVKIKK